MSRFRVEVLEPCALLAEPGDLRKTFEHIWEHIPKDHPRRLWWLLPELRLFVKGRCSEPRLSPRSLARSRRVRTEVRALRRFRERGAPVPRVHAYGFERRLGFHTRSWVVLEYAADTVDLKRYLRSGVDAGRPARRRLVFERAGEVIRALHATRCYHRDLTSRNVLLTLHDEDVGVRLVDCPRGLVDPPRPRAAWLRRGDLFRIVRSCMRDGASDDELAVLLERAGVQRPAVVLRAAHGATRRGRPFRVRVWLATGR